ncbi:Endo-1,4-beta-xylanase A precursor [Urinicoccus massiliensis]|uniref:Endo-1,4-beta-xylanase A n=1 Tax=Urinicoccus massiliensis TaxID=1723382 RepID=A0A8H2M6E1_9FIRM|nr:S-layer homology domain-containing protein [Urinicoccus massiliensis]VFB15696.1 Endo-1,4-beta-xylanase A precursor [Urinicoccus massiliensis]
MDKKRQVAGALSAILLVTSLPGPILAKEGQDLPGIKAEAEDSLHSRVLGAQVQVKEKQGPGLKTQEIKNTQALGENEADKDVIQDLVLKKLINQQLSKGENQREETQAVSKDDLASLTNLNSTGWYEGEEAITSLEGLQYAVNLQRAALPFMGTDLKPLSGLTNLNYLDIFVPQPKDESKPVKKSPLTDLNPLKNLNNLVHLYVDDTSVRDLSPIGNLESLDKLSLSGLGLKESDVMSLGEHAKKNGNPRTYIVLKRNEIADFSKIQGLNFYNIYAEDQEIRITPDSKTFKNPVKNWNGNYCVINNNKYLEVESTDVKNDTCKLTDFALESAKNEISVPFGDSAGNFNGKLIIDLSKLNKKSAGEEESQLIKDPELRKLINHVLEHSSEQEITEEDLKSEDLSYLIGQEQENQNIRSLEGLEKAVNLKRLEIYYTGNDLSPIKGLTKIEKLKLSPKAGSQEKLQLDSLEDLSNLDKLINLTINNAEIKDLSGLKNLKKIYTLNLENDNLEAKDLAVFDEMGKLPGGGKRTLLNLNGNKIQDVSSYQYKSFKKTTIAKQKIRITPEEKTFNNPIRHIKKGKTEVTPIELVIKDGFSTRMPENDPRNHLKEIKPTSENNLKPFEKYEIVGDLDGLSSFDAEFNSLGFPNTFNGTLTIDLSKIHQKDQEAKELEKAKKEAKTALQALITSAEEKLGDQEKTYTKESKEKLQTSLDAAKEALQGQDLDQLKEAKTALETALQELAEVSQEKNPVNIHVSGYEGDAWIQELYQAKVQVFKEDGTEITHTGASWIQWELAPGNYKAKISHPSYQTKEDTFTITPDKKDVYFRLEKEEEEYKQPKIKSIQLVEVGNPNKVLATGTIGGNIIYFVVEDAKDRKIIFDQKEPKATLKIEADNTYAFRGHTNNSPTDGSYRPFNGDKSDMNGTSLEGVPFKKDGITNLFLQGKGGKSTEYAMFIKEKPTQHAVTFSATADKDSATGSFRIGYKNQTSIQGYFCQTMTQLVEDGEDAKDPLMWVEEITQDPKGETTKKASLVNGAGQFKGWYNDSFGGKEYKFENNPVKEDMLLYARFSKTSSPTSYPDPFSVWIPMNTDPSDDHAMDLSWSVNEGTTWKDWTTPADIKVNAGDTLNLKIKENGTKWKLSGMTAKYGNLNLPIKKDKKGVYHLSPISSHDSTLFPDNIIYMSFVKKEDAGNRNFDLDKQHYIHLLQEGPNVEMTNTLVGTNFHDGFDLRGKFQEGDTIRFRVTGEEISDVKVQTQKGQEVTLSKDSDNTDKETGVITRDYSFVMPADDVDIIAKGIYKNKNTEARINFKIEDGEGKEISKDQVSSLTINAGYESKTWKDLANDEIYLPVNNQGITYGYTLVLKERRTYQGQFTLYAKNIPDPCVLTLKSKTEEKTKKEFDSLVATAEKLIKDSTYTQESRDKLQAAITSAKQAVELKQGYTAAYKIVSNAMDGLKKANTLPDKEKAKESLEGLIRRLSNLKKADYESKAWDAFDKEMYKAKAVLKDANSSGDALNSARIALTQAKAELDKHKIVPEDMTKEEKNLRDLIKTIERLEEKNYTKETWKDLKYALDDAKDELKYSKRTERSLERAYDKLNKAYKGLKLADKLAQEAEKINQDHKVLVRNSSYQNMTDIKSHWARDFIKYCMDRGYLVGTSITNFSPDRPTTRAEFVTVLSRLAGIKEENYKKNKFTDVPKGVYYEAAVNWAQEKKIVEGTGSSRFAPDQTMTREEMATILDRYFQVTNKAYGNRGALYFKDQGEMSTWAADSVKRMTQAGILHGTDRNTFEPKSSFTRAELATVIYQLNK